MISRPITQGSPPMTTSSDPTKFPGNITTVVNDTISSGAGLTTRFIQLNPNKRTNVLVVTGGETVTVSFAVAIQLADGTTLTNGTPITSANLNDASILFSQVFSGTDASFFAGNTRGVSIMKVVSTPVTNDVEWAVTEVTD